jgi:AcrR family transcriptional regulator
VEVLGVEVLGVEVLGVEEGFWLPEPVSKRQRRAAATSEQLLNAAREVFETRGYAGATVGAITETATTAHGTFYLYFKNKEDAFGRVMEQVTHEMFDEARSSWDGDAYQALHGANLRYLEVFERHRGLWRCLLEGMHRSKAVEEMWLQLRRPFLDRIARNLSRLSESGAIRPMDATMSAHALGSMAEWFAFTYVVLGEPPHEEVSLDRIATTITDLWYHAVYARMPESGQD